LTAAQGSAYTLLRREGSHVLSDEDRTMLLETVSRNLGQLQSLLGSLRVFSEVEGGSLRVTKTTTSVRGLFEDALRDFGVPPSGTRIDFDTPDNLEVAVDLVLFKQVLLNIIGNATKFSTPGSVIHVRACDSGSEVVFTVNNEGPGFSPEDGELIFKRDVRLQPRKQGLGLGLFVARAIVEAHDGRIWADGNPGRGATFSVAIPLAA
jgi:signal transduction histidine kinase